jgi:IS5 family transposase
MKTDGHLGRCHLKGREGDAANVVLTAIGHNLRLVLAWLRLLAPDLARPVPSTRPRARVQMGFLTDD